MKRPYEGRRILGLFPHPDDEAYSSAGTLAICARGGANVTVASATRGEMGISHIGLAKGRDLAGLRSAELEASCRVLGLNRPVFLDFPDGGMWNMDEGKAVRRIHELLGALQPEVLISLGPDGVYGHRDHVACTRFALQAVNNVRKGLRPRLLYAVFPKNYFLSVRQYLSRLDRLGRMLEPGHESIGMDVDQADLAVDINEVRDKKLSAIACHKSQLKGGQASTFLKKGLIDGLLKNEWFMCAAGPPIPVGGADPFAGI